MQFLYAGLAFSFTTAGRFESQNILSDKFSRGLVTARHTLFFQSGLRKKIIIAKVIYNVGTLLRKICQLRKNVKPIQGYHFH